MFTGALQVLQIPSLLVTLCLVLVIYQSTRLLRVLVLTRRSWLHYLPLIIPASLAFLAFQSLDASAQINEDICGSPNPTGICPIGQLHWTRDAFQAYVSHIVNQSVAYFLFEYQVFILLLLVSFLGMLLIEYRFLPRVPRPPIWQQYHSHLE